MLRWPGTRHLPERHSSSLSGMLNRYSWRSLRTFPAQHSSVDGKSSRLPHPGQSLRADPDATMTQHLQSKTGNGTDHSLSDSLIAALHSRRDRVQAKLDRCLRRLLLWQLLLHPGSALYPRLLPSALCHFALSLSGRGLAYARNPGRALIRLKLREAAARNAAIRGFATWVHAPMIALTLDIPIACSCRAISWLTNYSADSNNSRW
jgi:hypothetical protein